MKERLGAEAGIVLALPIFLILGIVMLFVWSMFEESKPEQEIVQKLKEKENKLKEKEEKLKKLEEKIKRRI